MIDFDQIFRSTKERPVKYKNFEIVRADKFPVRINDMILIKIELADSDRRQGLSIDISGSCEFEGTLYQQGKGIRMFFWEDTAPKNIKLQLCTKKDFVWVENIWESIDHRGVNYVDYGHNGAAMIVEEIENGRRYRCNDGHPDDDFDDIVFTVQRIL